MTQVSFKKEVLITVIHCVLPTEGSRLLTTPHAPNGTTWRRTRVQYVTPPTTQSVPVIEPTTTPVWQTACELYSYQRTRQVAHYHQQNPARFRVNYVSLCCLFYADSGAAPQPPLHCKI